VLNELEKLHLKLRSLAIFRNLLGDRVLTALDRVLSCADRPATEQADAYSAFVSRLYAAGGDLGAHVLELVLSDENAYVRRRAQKQPACRVLEECLQNELNILEEVSRLRPVTVQKHIAYSGFLPAWTVRETDFKKAYADRMDSLSIRGYGVFSVYHVFTLEGGAPTPVKRPDPVRLTDLKGYEDEREAVIANTRALLKGRPAANVLLYGDAGTGKSSTVKAVVNAFRGEGLRLIEIAMTQFRQIPGLIERLSDNPLKFILFIDDLSFAKETADFGALKAVLEGSVSSRGKNLAIYATSNRRRLVKESFSDRSEDVHRSETLQELSSLSERFGLSVRFFRPDKAQYLDIVRALGAQYGLGVGDAKLEAEAERYALQRGGRSPRVARQFVEYLKSTGE
jgi:hypothetical protein